MLTVVAHVAQSDERNAQAWMKALVHISKSFKLQIQFRYLPEGTFKWNYADAGHTVSVTDISPDDTDDLDIDATVYVVNNPAQTKAKRSLFGFVFGKKS